MKVGLGLGDTMSIDDEDTTMDRRRNVKSSVGKLISL